MARAAVKAKQAQRAKTAPKPHGRRKHSGGGNPNQELFFTRLRTHAKWVYVLLAVLFAVTFAFRRSFMKNSCWFGFPPAACFRRPCGRAFAGAAFARSACLAFTAARAMGPSE